MTPFEEFKFWLRQGAPWERAAAALAAVIVLGLVAWVVIPVNGNNASGGTNNVAAGAGQPGVAGAQSQENGSPATSTPTAAAGATSNGSAAPQSASAAAGGATQANSSSTGQVSSGATSSQCPTGNTDQGVTDSTISIAVILLDVAGGNSILGVPPADEQRRENDAMVAYYNGKGGIRCRKIVAKYYTDNPLDANSEHAICLDIVASKVFAVIGGLYQAQNSTCLAQSKLPSYTQTTRPTSEMKKFAPYLFSFYVDSATNFAIYVAGSKEQGFFNGMTKLGVITGDCYPEYNDQLLGALSKIGISGNKMVTFNYGCPPGGIAPPSTVSQAVLRFKGAGVNRVMTSGFNLGSFSRQAQSQGYKPSYSTTDVDTTLQLTNSAGFAPDPQNFDGALNIANNQYGALNTPGTPISSTTQECDAALTKGGAQKATDGIGYAGGTCNQWNMFFLGTTKGPSLVRTQLAAGLNTVGRFEQAYPGAPALWNNPSKTWAGPYWRPVRYVGSCNCWKVISASFSDASV